MVERQQPQDSKAPTTSGSGLLQHAQQTRCREVPEVLPRGPMLMTTNCAPMRVISWPSLVPLLKLNLSSYHNRSAED